METEKDNVKKPESWSEVKPGVWEYEKTPELVGVLVESKSNVGPNLSNLYTIQKDDNTLISVWGSTILDTRLQFVKLGERVKIVFEGRAVAKPGRKGTLLFKVYHSAAIHKKDSLEEDEKVEETQEEETQKEETTE